MNKKIGILCSLLLLVLCSCRNDLDTLSGGNEGAEGLPVQFMAEYPEDGLSVATRAGLLSDKTEFVAKDVIHVSATFYSDDASDTSTEGVLLATKYTTLTLDESGQWVNKNTALDMSWPWNSKYAVFKAYYLAGNDAALGGENLKPDEAVTTDPVLLDRFVHGTEVANPDPLEAVTERVEYGHAVELKFKHSCTRLTIVGVGDEDEYWLKFKSSSERSPLLNAYRLERKNNELTLDFMEEESGKVSAPVYEMTTKDGKKLNAVTFHLAPDNYRTFSLTRRNGYGYITISNVEELADLKSNESHQVSIENLMGHITQDDDDDDWWDGEVEDMPKLDDFSVQKFMEAIRDCKDYACSMQLEGGEKKDVLLLESNSYLHEVKLKMDVDFEGAEFNSVQLESTYSFDGGGYAISGVKHTLFSSLDGRVSNLKLNNVELECIDDSKRTSWGILANECSGTVNNVYLNDGRLKLEISTDGTYNIGLLIGWVKSGGTLSGINLMGDLEVTVSSSDNLKQTGYFTHVGGVIGQCSGVLCNCDITGSMKVTNSCVGYSSRYTGGIAGLVAGGSINVGSVHATVDAGKAIGTWNYVGGVAGSLRTDPNSSVSAITGVNVSGSVTGGQAFSVKSEVENKAHSSTGGIVGHVQYSSVKECTASNCVLVGLYLQSVEGQNSDYYSIGGCIGSIVSEEAIEGNHGKIGFNADYYNTDETHNSYYHAGTFAGIGSEDKLKGVNSAKGQGAFVGTEYE